MVYIFWMKKYKFFIFKVIKVGLQVNIQLSKAQQAAKKKE